MNPNNDYKKMPFYIMLITNLILAVAIIGFLHSYVLTNTNRQAEKYIEATNYKCETVTEQLENYLVTFGAIGSSYATYIESEDLTLEETMNYLSSWSEFYSEITMLNADNYGAWILRRGNKQVIFSSMEEKAWAKELCLNYEKISKSEGTLLVTDVYYSPDLESEMIAFYQPVMVKGEKYIMLFNSTLEELQNGGLNVQGLKAAGGIVIDKEGYILLGELSFVQQQNLSNYFDFLLKNFNQSTYREIHDSMEENLDGIVNVTDANDEEYAVIYHSVDGTDGWKYVYYQKYDDITEITESKRAAVASIIFMGIWLLLDISVYFVYNKKLRKSIMIIQEQNEHLLLANKAKTSFVSNISHEIRTPINAVLGLDEMIIRECQDEKIRGYAYEIETAGRVLLGLINDVLDFSKIESGKLEIVPGEYDLAKLVSEVSNMISIKAKAKYLNFEIKIAPDIPNILYGDEIRIRQVITNLLTNAVKYTDKGSVTLEIGYECLTDEKVKLKVAVKDTGIGIKPDELEKLFSEYDRLDIKKNRGIEGTGLGLSIVHRILDMMNSKIEVESVYGLGSVFSFELEQTVVDATPIGDFETRKKEFLRREKTVTEQVGFTAPKAQVLVVDDTPVNLTVVKGLLKHTGIHIDVAEDGVQCLEKAEKKQYDLILLDHRMPRMDGIEAIHRLRNSTGCNQNTPVIALTANVISGAKEMYMKEGFNDFLSKPITGLELEQMILQYLPKEYISYEKDQTKESDRAPEDHQNMKAETEDERMSEKTLIHAKKGLSMCGDMEVYREVIQGYISQSEGMEEKIRITMENHDAKEYTTLVHGMKSSSRILGADSLADMALHLEECGNREDWQSINAETEELFSLYRQVVEEAKTFEI